MSSPYKLTWQQLRTIGELRCRITNINVSDIAGYVDVFDGDQEMACIRQDGGVMSGYTFSDGSTVHPTIEATEVAYRQTASLDEQVAAQPKVQRTLGAVD